MLATSLPFKAGLLENNRKNAARKLPVDPLSEVTLKVDFLGRLLRHLSRRIGGTNDTVSNHLRRVNRSQCWHP